MIPRGQRGLVQVHRPLSELVSEVLPSYSLDSRFLSIVLESACPGSRAKTHDPSRVLPDRGRLLDGRNDCGNGNDKLGRDRCVEVDVLLFGLQR